GRLYVLGSSRLNVPVLSVKPDSADAWIDTTRKIIVATTAASRGEELEWRSPSLTGINGTTLVLFVKAGREGTTYELRLGSATGLPISRKFEPGAAANEFLVAMRKTAALTRLMGGTSRSGQDSVIAKTPVDDCLLSSLSAAVNLVGDMPPTSAARDYVESVL